MAEFDIEKVTENVGQAVKKNPLPWLIGLGAVVAGGMYMLGRRASAAPADVAITELPTVPETTQDITSGTGGSDISQALSDLLNAQTQMFAEWKQAEQEQLSQTISDLVNAQTQMFAELRQAQAEQTQLTQEMLRNLSADIRSSLGESINTVKETVKTVQETSSATRSRKPEPSYRYAGSKAVELDAAAKVIELKETYMREAAAYGPGFNKTERARELENLANYYRAIGNLDPKKYGAAVTLEQAKKAYQQDKRKFREERKKK